MKTNAEAQSGLDDKLANGAQEAQTVAEPAPSASLLAKCAEIRVLMREITPGPVHANGRAVQWQVDEEVRHIASCGWDGEADFYVALRNAAPDLLAAAEQNVRLVALLRRVWYTVPAEFYGDAMKAHSAALNAIGDFLKKIGNG